jgi:hypothetical protein
MAERFEYAIDVLEHGLMGVHKGELKREALQDILDARGEDGWELVHLWFDQQMQGEKDGHLLIFRRRRDA